MTDTISLTGTVATPLKRMSTSSGISIVTFRLASAQRRFDRTRSVWIDGETNWYSVSLFRQLADHADASLSKGDRVIVSGRLRIRSWQKDDKSGTSVEIDAESIGPDLLFGTTTFSKSPPRAAEPEGHVGAERGEFVETGAQDPGGRESTPVATPQPGLGLGDASAGVTTASPEAPPADQAEASRALVPEPGWHVASVEAPF